MVVPRIGRIAEPREVGYL